MIRVSLGDAMKPTICLLLTLLCCNQVFGQDYQVPRTEWGAPDFRGVWRYATLMPFERPVELGEKRTFTEDEVLTIERAQQQRFDNANNSINLDPEAPPVAESLPRVGNYDLFWRDEAQFIPTIGGEYRTSAIIDPPNGRMPPPVPEMSRRLNEAGAGESSAVDRVNDGPEGRSLAERCLVSVGNLSGPVLTPFNYNSNLQIVQSPGFVVVIAEMVHDARVIRISDQRNPAAASHRKWMGDSIGRWDGDTLVVETKFFNLWHRFRGFPVDNLTVIESFRRQGVNKIVYGFTVDDPTVFTAQFSGEYPMSRIDQPLYEYACHEGNRAMLGILAGARREDVESE